MPPEASAGTAVRGTAVPAKNGKIEGVAQHSFASRAYRDDAVVLRTHKLGEADRIITLLTKHHGQLRAVAKGVRRTSSRTPATAVSTDSISTRYISWR